MMIQITETTKELTAPLNPIIEKMNGWKEDGFAMLPNIVVAILFLFIFIYVAKTIKRLMDKYLYKTTENNALVSFISNLVYIIVLLLGVALALSILDLDDTVNKILAAAGIVGVALGFAFQDVASNFISGTFMAFRSNFMVGDLIETNGTKAVVETMDLRSTTLRTLDGLKVFVPNKEIFQHKLTNYNAYSSRRLSVLCSVDYSSDLDLVERITLEEIAKIEDIKDVPSPQFFYTEFADSAINFEVMFWIDFLSPIDTLNVKHRVIKAIKKRFDQEGVTIPYPIRSVELKGKTPPPAVK